MVPIISIRRHWHNEGKELIVMAANVENHYQPTEGLSLLLNKFTFYIEQGQLLMNSKSLAFYNMEQEEPNLGSDSRH